MTAIVKKTVDVAIIGSGTAGMGAYRAARKYTDNILVIEAGEYGITGTPGVIILDRKRSIHFDLRTLPRIEPPASANAKGHRRKAAYKAPCLAVVMR